MDATIAGKPAIPDLQSALPQWLAKLNLMSWRTCENRNRKAHLSNFYKDHFGTNESIVKQVPFGVTALCKQSALQEPEFLNIMLCSRRLVPGAFLVDVFVQQLELAERSGCWSRLRAFRHGSHRLRKRAIWRAKQQPFSPPLRLKAEIFQSEAEAKGVAFVKEKGTVKWFNGAKGYGFIQRSTGEDVFVHFSAIQENGYRTLNEGETVEYELMKGPKGFLAANVLRGSAAN
jgi:CspA family cold shock protein